MEQRNLFIGNGFNLVEMWECQWCDLKHTLGNKEQLETNANNQTLLFVMHYLVVELKDSKPM